MPSGGRGAEGAVGEGERRDTGKEAEVNGLRAEIDDSASVLKSVLDDQNEAARKRSEEVQKLKGEVTALKADKERLTEETERLHRDVEALQLALCNSPHQVLRNVALPINHDGRHRQSEVPAPAADRFGPRALANVQVERPDAW